MRLGIVHQFLGRSLFDNLTLAEQNNSVIVHDGIDPVRNCNDRTILKFCSYCFLNDFIRLIVNVSGSFVKYKYFWPS